MQTQTKPTTTRAWWRHCLRTAGFPEYWHPNAISIRELKEVQHLRISDPDVYEVLEEACRRGMTEFNLRAARLIKSEHIVVTGDPLTWAERCQTSDAA